MFWRILGITPSGVPSNSVYRIASVLLLQVFSLSFAFPRHHKRCRVCGPKVKRRVVKRAFYSSEEDESTEEEIEERDVSTTTPEVSYKALWSCSASMCRLISVRLVSSRC